MRFLRSKSLFIIGVLAFALGLPLFAQDHSDSLPPDNPALFPLSDVKPGMKGVVYTIFAGDQVEKVDLEVIGLLHNALGPKEDVILVKLLGDKAAQTGVAAGMSGSPVYFDGKLAGALALKLGAFTKDAIGGVTPIADMLDVEKYSALDAPETPIGAGAKKNAANHADPGSQPDMATAKAVTRIDVPAEFLRRTSLEGTGSGQFLVPIETPLVYSGLFPEAALQFGKELSAWGMSMMAGGTEPASPADANIKPGDMVGIDLIRGDLSVSSGCTVTWWIKIICWRADTRFIVLDRCRCR